MNKRKKKNAMPKDTREETGVEYSVVRLMVMRYRRREGVINYRCNTRVKTEGTPSILVRGIVNRVVSCVGG